MQGACALVFLPRHCALRGSPVDVVALFRGQLRQLWLLDHHSVAYERRTAIRWCVFSLSSRVTLLTIYPILVQRCECPDNVSDIKKVSVRLTARGRVSTPIQQLFAWRIKQFTHSWWIFGLLSGLSIASMALGVLAAAEGLRRHEYVDIQPPRAIPRNSWLNGTGVQHHVFS